MEMKNKTIILGLVAVVALAGIFWYGGWGKGNQTASVIGGEQNKNSDENIGINVNSFIIGGDIALGSPDAPVTMIEYSSHLCGHCVNFHLNTLPTLIEKYVQTGQLKIISRLVSPLDLSNAVICAGEQNAFYQFDEYLFSHIQDLSSVDDIRAIAGRLGLSQEIFDACYDDADKYRDQIEGWFAQAEVDGVTGTPTFFINGEEIVGNQSLEVFESVIEKYLNQ